jgi:hypothetical protein
MVAHPENNAKQGGGGTCEPGAKLPLNPPER